MAILTGDQYLEYLVRFVETHTAPLIEGSSVLKLNPVGLHYVQSRFDDLDELESLISAAPVDYLRAYISDLGDHRALEQLRRILRLLPSLKIVSALPPPARDPIRLSLKSFSRLKVLELRGCDLSTSSSSNGLLELRHTLEKFICHNSTEALMHVFASRVTNLRSSSNWNQLSIVSCAYNGLLLMDESLQLLPAVETLDLSRNKFTKLDNLHTCSNLKHLDLGFNRLRTISSFAKVSCGLMKLILRNNALTTLRGIENLRTLEALDLSYNVISRMKEMEYLAGVRSLRRIWLEGNPLCCVRWYRPNLFGYFDDPHVVIVDDEGLSMKEAMHMRMIVTARVRTPPLPSDGHDVCIPQRKTKPSRLISFEGDDDDNPRQRNPSTSVAATVDTGMYSSVIDRVLDLRHSSRRRPDSSPPHYRDDLLDARSSRLPATSSSGTDDDDSSVSEESDAAVTFSDGGRPRGGLTGNGDDDGVHSLLPVVADVPVTNEVSTSCKRKPKRRIVILTDNSLL